MKVSTLKDQAASIRRAMRASLDNRPGKLWTDTDQARFDADTATLDRLSDTIRRLEAAQERDQLAAYGVSELDQLEHRAVFAAWARGGEVALEERQRKIVNTMSTTTGSQGGFTVPTLVGDQLFAAMKLYSAVRSVAEVLPTPTGGPLSFPTSDGTGEVGELIAENVTATAADPVFGTASVPTYKYSSKVFTVPFELLQDSAIDLEQFLSDRAAERIGRAMNPHFTTGTGTGQPAGFVTGATVAKTGTTGQTLTIIHDDVIDLVHSVDPAYRQPGSNDVGAVFMCSDAMFKVMRKVKDSSARPLYLPDELDDGESVMGYRVAVNNDMAVPAANAKSLAFGNFHRAYKVRDAMLVAWFRLPDSAYAKLGQLGFLALCRSGGALVDTGGVKLYAHSAT